MNTRIETLHKNEKKVFVLSYIAIAVIFLSVTLLSDLPVFQAEDAVKANTFAILFTLLAIPLSLKGYAKSIKDIYHIKDKNIIAGKYKKAGLLRMILLSSAVCIDIITYGFTKDPSMIICALIPLASTFFCIPSSKRIRFELTPDEIQANEEVSDAQ